MLTDGSRVRCNSFFFETSHLYGKTGTVVSSCNDRYKVLLDKDQGKCPDPLTLAYWFFVDELEPIEEGAT